MSKKKRALYLEIVRRNVTYLVEHDRWEALDHVMDLTGVVRNCAMTSDMIGAAIIALAGVITDELLRDTVEGAVFHRVLAGKRSNNARANELADRAVRSPELALRTSRQAVHA